MSEDERRRRWMLALGVEDGGDGASPLSESDRRLSDALSSLYGDGEDGR